MWEFSNFELGKRAQARVQRRQIIGPPGFARADKKAFLGILAGACAAAVICNARRH